MSPSCSPSSRRPCQGSLLTGPGAETALRDSQDLLLPRRPCPLQAAGPSDRGGGSWIIIALIVPPRCNQHKPTSDTPTCLLLVLCGRHAAVQAARPAGSSCAISVSSKDALKAARTRARPRCSRFISVQLAHCSSWAGSRADADTSMLSHCLFLSVDVYRTILLVRSMARLAASVAMMVIDAAANTRSLSRNWPTTVR